MIKIVGIFFAFCAFFYSELALATPSPGAGWVQGLSATGQKVWFGPGYLTKSPTGPTGMGQAVWAAAVGGGAVSTAVAVPVGAGSVAAVALGTVSASTFINVVGSVLGGYWGAAAFVATVAIPAVSAYLLQAKVKPAPAAGSESFVISGELTGNCAITALTVTNATNSCKGNGFASGTPKTTVLAN